MNRILATNLHKAAKETRITNKRMKETGADKLPVLSCYHLSSVTAKYKGVLSLSFDDRVQVLTITEESEGVRTRTIFKCIDAAEFPPIH